MFVCVCEWESVVPVCMYWWLWRWRWRWQWGCYSAVDTLRIILYFPFRRAFRFNVKARRVVHTYLHMYYHTRYICIRNTFMHNMFIHIHIRIRIDSNVNRDTSLDPSKPYSITSPTEPASLTLRWYVSRSLYYARIRSSVIISPSIIFADTSVQM